jgi:hypothetical protein
VNVTCPACRAEMSLDVLLAGEDTRHVLAELVTLSLPFGALTLRYIALFRPEKRQLTHRRMLALVGELLQDVHRGAITRRGREWPVSLALWSQALDAVLAARDKGQLTLPLTSHGYLYEVLCALADKQEAEQERQVEQDRRSRPREATGPTGGPVQVLGAVPVVASAAVPALPTRPSPGAQRLREQIAAIQRSRLEPAPTTTDPQERPL